MHQNGQSSADQRRARRSLFRSNARLWGLLIAAGAILLFAAPVQAAIDAQEGAATPEPSLWFILLPLMAASLAIERGVEMFWNYIDWVLLNFRRWQPAQVKSPQYVQFKSGTSLVLSVVLGILISNYTGMRLFDYLRPLVPNFVDSVPGVWDVIITGFIIGAGAKPMHDLIGMLTQTKNLLGNSAIKQRETAGAAVADSMLKIAQSEAQAMIDVPGVGPARLSAPGDAGDDEEATRDAFSTAVEYLDDIRNRTVI